MTTTSHHDKPQFPTTQPIRATEKGDLCGAAGGSRERDEALEDGVRLDDVAVAEIRVDASPRRVEVDRGEPLGPISAGTG